MAESIVQVTEGAGKKLHTWSRTVGANTVEDEVVAQGEGFLPTYTAHSGITAISAATSADHLLQLMAGASLNLRIRRIRVTQAGLITAAAQLSIGIYRLTTAGTGGTVVTPRPRDTADTAGASAMSIPTVKGTEGVLLDMLNLWPIQTAPTGGLSQMPYDEWTEEAPGRTKPIIVPAGAANGIALKVITGRAGLSIYAKIDFSESSYL